MRACGVRVLLARLRVLRATMWHKKRSCECSSEVFCVVCLSRHTRCVAALLLCSVRAPPHKRAATWHVAFATVALCACEGSRRGVRPARAGVRTADCGVRYRTRNAIRDGSIGNIMHGKRNNSKRSTQFKAAGLKSTHFGSSQHRRLKSTFSAQVNTRVAQSQKYS